MNKKYIGILIVILGLIALVVVIYFMFFYYSSPKDQVKEEEQAQETPELAQEKSIVTPKRVIITAEQPKFDEVTKDDLKGLAKSFAERFGSYSNQSNYGNIKDLEIFMSRKMKDWADNYINEAIAKDADTSIYVGMTTKAVSGKVKQFDDDLGRAIILVSTQRRMATGSMSNAVSLQQDITINFVRERGVWKVDSAEWQEVF